MYRDADDALRERHAAALERGARQLEGLSAEDLASLPEPLRDALAELEPRVAPESIALAAILDAERALDERELLLKEARALLRREHKAARRERRDRALVRGIVERRLRQLALALVLVAAVAVPGYVMARRWVGSECRASATCHVRGDCSATYDLACRPGSDRDCERSEDCAHYGWCTRVGGQCRARGASDCAHVERCKEPASCEVVLGVCVDTR